MSVRAFLTALALMTCATTALADRDDVRCVQHQLNAAGFDVGGVDGIVGRRTRGALRDFEQSHDLETGHRLHRENAASHCRRIGQADPALREFWAAPETPLEFVFSDTVPENLQLHVRTYVTALHRNVAHTLGVKVASTDTIIVGTTSRELARLFERNSEYRLRNARQAMQRHCDAEDGIGGGATPGITFFCIDPELDMSDNYTRMALDNLFAHEAMHLVQFQISGAGRPGLSRRDWVDIHSPIWFTEGLAQIHADTVSTGAPVRRVRIHYLRLFNGDPLPDLSQFEHYSVLPEHEQEVYFAGAIAVAYLITRYGYEGITELLEAQADGMIFAEAFDATFDETLSEFYESFPLSATPDNMLTRRRTRP